MGILRQLLESFFMQGQYETELNIPGLFKFELIKKNMAILKGPRYYLPPALEILQSVRSAL